MALPDDLARAATAAAAHAVPGEAVVGVLASEPAAGTRVYLCAFAAGEDVPRSWLALDDEGSPLADRQLVADAVSMAALCEVAAEAAFPGDLDEHALHDPAGASPFASAMRGAQSAVDGLRREVEAGYRLHLT